MSDNTVHALPSSAEAYARHGWKLVPIPLGSKGPNTAGWNAPDAPREIPPNCGIGLAHAYSGTMALDIDDWNTAAAYLAQGGIDLRALYDAPDAVVVDSSRPGHGKLLYAMPYALPSKKLVSGRSPFLEFRCGTLNGLTVQDCIPPTIHPDTGQPYRWAGRGHWSRLPVIPAELLTVWTRLLDLDRAPSIPTGDKLPASWDDIRGALWSIPADCARDTWIACGMALHWAGHQTGQLDMAFDLWHEWSASAPAKYPGEREVMTQWRAMRVDKLTHVTVGTLFHHAKRHGWQRPQPDAATLFSAIDPPEQPTILESTWVMQPPEIPLDVFPASLRAIAEEVARGVGCDPLVPLASGMAAACAVADARIRLELHDGYEVPPVLWMVTIGHPADKKSPGSRPMMRILTELEAADRPRFAAAMLAWEAIEAGHAAAKRAYLEAAESPEHMMGAPLPPVPDLPPQPVPLRLTVEDVTSQKLVRHAAERPMGFLCYQDEMNSWIRKVCDPRSGEDRSAWVRAYEAQPYSMDRVGAGSIYAENLAVSFYGNVQPKVLKDSMHMLIGDGLFQRFAMFPLRERFTKRGEPLPDSLSCRPLWDNTLRLVHAIPAQVYRMSPEAYEAFRDFQTWYESLKADLRVTCAVEAYQQAIGKLEGTTGRFMLMFHLLEAPFASHVGRDVAERAIRLVQDYVVPALAYTFNHIGDLESGALTTWVREYVISCAGDMESLTLSELRRGARRQVEHLAGHVAELKLADAMAELEQARWVMRLDEARNSVRWVINPALAAMFADYRHKIIMARQRNADRVNVKLSPLARRRTVRGYHPDMGPTLP